MFPSFHGFAVNEEHPMPEIILLLEININVKICQLIDNGFISHFLSHHILMWVELRVSRKYSEHY